MTDDKMLKAKEELVDKTARELKVKKMAIDNAQMSGDIKAIERIEACQKQINEILAPFPDVNEYQNWNKRIGEIHGMATQINILQNTINFRQTQLDKDNIIERNEAFKDGIIPKEIMQNFIWMDQNKIAQLKCMLDFALKEVKMQKMRLEALTEKPFPYKIPTREELNV